jgi:hypothetical protein
MAAASTAAEPEVAAQAEESEGVEREPAVALASAPVAALGLESEPAQATEELAPVVVAVAVEAAEERRPAAPCTPVPQRSQCQPARRQNLRKR